MEIEEQIASRFMQVSPNLNERALRLFVAAEANAFGRGGIATLNRITGIARSTIMRGQEELAEQAAQQATHETNQRELLNDNDETQPNRIRRPGGGRKRKDYHLESWTTALEKLIEPVARGDPESSLRWTIKSTKSLSEELKNQGFNVSPNTVMRQLHEMGYSLQSNFKTITKASHPDRNAQFEYINNKVTDFIVNNNPVISVDTKKKEIIGNFKNNGQKWALKGDATKVNDHDFPDPSLPRALPFGIYDIDNNIGHIVIGTDHDTSEFAVNSIYGWWKKYGDNLYSNANKLLITADSGGSNGYRLNLWKYCLQNICDKINFPISICHFPPGTSKWNKIEHKLFSFISSNWRGEPLIDYETAVKLISSTKTKTGLSVSCILDFAEYKIGLKLTNEQLTSINIIRDDFHGEWNYTILPH